MYQEEQNKLLKKFIGKNSEYYKKQFQLINSTSKFVWSFNFLAALLGPIWFGMRGI